jgi:ABC-2 type transport system permease protein
MNVYGVRAIYFFELTRWFRTLVQSVLSPVISTSW